jgi:hypothetical protein
MVVLTSHLTLVHIAIRPYMDRAYANPTGYFSDVQRDEMIGLETESGLGWLVGWWTVSRDRLWLGVAYVWTVMSGSNLWVKYTSSTELEIHLNGRILGIG